MYVSAHVAITPTGTEQHTLPAWEHVFLAAGLHTEPRDNGATVTGDWHTVLAALEKCHQLMHARGAATVDSAIRVL